MHCGNAPCLQVAFMQKGQIPLMRIPDMPAHCGIPGQVGLLPAQVRSGDQLEAMPSASASREASVLELADLDREVTCHALFPDTGHHAFRVPSERAHQDGLHPPHRLSLLLACHNFWPQACE